MSLFGSMTSGVSGLTAQSSAMGAIADNITNVNTVGFKNVITNFQTLVTKQTSVTFYSAGGVQSRPLSMNDVQGLLKSTSSQTNIGISGGGFFVVNEAAVPGPEDEFLFTRAGAFFKDDEGFLRNTAGYYLQGWPVDPLGNVILPADSNASLTNQNVISSDFLETVNLNRIGGTAKPTSKIAIGANLPATADIGHSEASDVQFYDTLGTTHEVSFRFTKIAANDWDVTVEPPPGTANLTLHGPVGDGSDVYKSIGQLEFTAQPRDGASVVIDGRTFEFDSDAIQAIPGSTLVTLAAPDNLAGTVANLVARVQATHPSFAAGSEFNAIAAKTGNATAVVLTGGIDGHGGVVGDFTVDFSGLVDAAGQPVVRQTDAGSTSLEVQASDYALADPAIGFAPGGLPSAFNIVKLSARGFVNGAADLNEVDLDGDGTVDVSQVTLDFGTTGQADGMTQYSSDFSPTFIDQNGARFGTFSGLTIDEDGLVTALFDNGELRPIFKLPLATFVNPNGLEARTGNVWNAIDQSGDPTLREANKGPAGSINQSTLEASTVDIGTEFTEMILVQRAYSAATKIITTVDDMLEELIRIK